ncbi:hypothetical protein ACFL6U_03400 [Planctomycetota bacterium]
MSTLQTRKTYAGVKRNAAVLLFILGIPAMLFAESVGVFFNQSEPQDSFAAGDVKAALEAEGYTVEMKNLSSLASSYPNKKVVISLASNNTVTAVFTEQNGSIPTGLGEQAYGLRTTTNPQLSYWAFGGDVSGNMYGGLQIAENIKFYGLAGTYNLEEAPTILKRGLKLNLPLDQISHTYQDETTAAQKAIPNVWDMSFWTTFFDESARNRYNVISIWNDHPFTSMVKLDDYPNVVIQDVTGFDGYSKTMSIEEKIDFWKEVMAYAKSRGFEFLLVTWNLFTHGATGKYGITEDPTNQNTIKYMRLSVEKLLETYPDLDGIGITQGEHMSDNDTQNSEFLAKTYGQGMANYAQKHPNRKLRFIHRWHSADFTAMKENFGSLFKQDNITFDMSYKWSIAHMYGTPVPNFMNDTHFSDLAANELMSWLTLRNDDFYFHDWGDPAYARTYLNGILSIGADWFRGFNMGSDGFQPTRTFYSKNSVTQGLLEVQRQWYMNMIWGRLSYNPQTPDQVFENILAHKFPEISAKKFFAAWSEASRGLPKVTELVQKTMRRDSDWWPEACQTKKHWITVSDFANAKPGPGSTVCSIAKTAKNSCGGAKNAYEIADEIEADALSALATVSSMNGAANTMLGVTIKNIKSMSYLTLYYACKIRGATDLNAGEMEGAKTAMGKAYCHWMKYSEIMDSMYTGMEFQKTLDLPNWHSLDKVVLKEYTDLGGEGIPSCEE